MLEGLKRLFAGPAGAAEWADVSAWAQRRGYGFKRARDAYDSFVGHIEGSIRGVWTRQTSGAAAAPKSAVLNGSTRTARGSER